MSRASASVIIVHAPSRDPGWLVYFMENPIKMDEMDEQYPHCGVKNGRFQGSSENST
jgi:hypothetical protein